MRTRKKGQCLTTREHNSKIATGTEGTGEMERVGDTRKDWRGLGQSGSYEILGTHVPGLPSRTGLLAGEKIQGVESKLSKDKRERGKVLIKVQENRYRKSQKAFRILILCQNTEEAL